MFLDRDATDVLLPILVLNDADSPQTGITWDGGTITLQYLVIGTGWTTITLANMTAPQTTHVDNGWYEVSDGTYLFGVPDSWQNPGGSVHMRYRVSGSTSWRYDSIEYIGGANVTVSTEDLQAAFTATWTQAANLPFMPIDGEFQIVEGDDHKAVNDRGAIGPFSVTTNVDLQDPDITLRVGFSQKLSGTLYGGDEFDGTAYHELVDGHDYSDKTIEHPYDVYIEIDGTSTAGKTAGIYGVDVEAVQDVGELGTNIDIITIMRTECYLNKSFGTYV